MQGDAVIYRKKPTTFNSTILIRKGGAALSICECLGWSGTGVG